jgi:hypothetical protein
MNISHDALNALLELEAETLALEACISVDEARQTVREVWHEGELELRIARDGRYILWRREETPKPS